MEPDFVTRAIVPAPTEGFSVSKYRRVAEGGAQQGRHGSCDLVVAVGFHLLVASSTCATRLRFRSRACRRPKPMSNALDYFLASSQQMSFDFQRMVIHS
jgi:hypothetical protein